MSERKKRVGRPSGKQKIKSHLSSFQVLRKRLFYQRSSRQCSASRGLSEATLRPHLLLGPSATSEQWFLGPNKHPLVTHQHHPNRFFCFLVKLLRKSHQSFPCYSQSKSQLPSPGLQGPVGFRSLLPVCTHFCLLHPVLSALATWLFPAHSRRLFLSPAALSTWSANATFSVWSFSPIYLKFQPPISPYLLSPFLALLCLLKTYYTTYIL